MSYFNHIKNTKYSTLDTTKRLNKYIYVLIAQRLLYSVLNDQGYNPSM